MTTPAQAQALARRLLHDPLPRRWAHTQGVAATAAAIATALTHELGVLIAAAWLHDIGQTPAIASSGTGFHPLDGARYLRDAVHAGSMVCRLVAHHSCAMDGVAELGLAGDLAREFPRPPEGLADALTYCDMTTSPDGEPVPVEQRLAEICARYGPGHAVTRAITTSAPQITTAVYRVCERLAARTASQKTELISSVRRQHTICRLTGPECLRIERLVNRMPPGPSRDWHIARTTELESLLEGLALEHFVVENDSRPVRAVAMEVLERAGWLKAE